MKKLPLSPSSVLLAVTLASTQAQETAATPPVAAPAPAVVSAAAEPPAAAPAPAPATAPATAPAPAAAPTQTLNTGSAQPPILPTAPAGPEDPKVAEMRKQTAKLAAERDRLMTENAIAKERLAAELNSRRADLERASLKAEEEKARIAAEFEVAKQKADRELTALRMESEKLALEGIISKGKAEIRLSDLRLQETEARSEITRLSTVIEQKEKELSAAQYAESKPSYSENPHQGNTLIVSDRRIALNGAIMSNTADDISEKIAYFNNKNSKLPIFIVIDNSPGGSVMAGYRILKAMQGSEAPVYVVVKSFAASMAACIATLADKSFAYPNAIILHHQISSASFGNLTQQKESIQEIEEWWQRLAGPIAKKMGISTEDFIKKMYSKVSSGDWSEFGDKATQLKWVDHIVDDIRETAQVKHPDLTPKPVPTFTILPIRGATSSAPIPYLTEGIDEKGRPCMFLPRPNPKDVFYLYNPDGYYRLP
jgi:ATP-dependent Clp protease protease subunit